MFDCTAIESRITYKNRFVNITSNLKQPITITDGNGLRVNAKSVIGVLHALEFDNLICETEKNNDIYMAIKEFVIE